jgi:anti-anti-sigma factor
VRTGHAGTRIVDAYVGAPARSRPRPRCPAGASPHRPRCHTARGAPPIAATGARGPFRTPRRASAPRTHGVDHEQEQHHDHRPAHRHDSAGPGHGTRPAGCCDPVHRQRAASTRTTPAAASPSASRSHARTAVSAVEVNLGTPIDIAVQGWCGDAVAVVAVDGQIDADSCAALATAVAQATQTHRAVIIDLTPVRLLSAAGLHCLDCMGQLQDQRRGVVHLVCAESSAVRGVLQQAQLHHRWPVHPDLMDALRQVMRPPADPPEPTGALPRTTPSGGGSRSVVKPDSRPTSPALARSQAR